MNKNSISLDAGNGSYSICLSGVELKGCKVAVTKTKVFGDEADCQIVSPLTLSDDGKAITGECEAGKVKILIGETEKGVRLSTSLELKEECRRIDLSPIYGITIENATHLYCNGRSMGGCRTCKLPSDILVTDFGETPDAAFESHFQTVISFGETKLHISQPIRQPNIARVDGLSDGKALTNVAVTTRFEFPQAGTLNDVPVSLEIPEDALKALCDYGDANAEVKLPDEPQPIGWNSWDYYRWTITEEEVLKNADFVASDPVLSKYIKRFIVDDGWQYCYGEWDANPLFPSGMPALAKNLSKMGFIPGLWLCPYIAEPQSRIGQWDWDMLALSEGGFPCLAYECMRRHGFILDPTIEKTKKFVYDLFTRYSDYGYEYFKIDFLMSLFKAPRLHDNTLPRGELLRTALRPIVDATRDRATILGCGFAYEAGDDLVQMVRAGSDIHATWRNAKSNAVAVASRAWASNRVWVTDPDFCVCRGPETVNDPNRGRLQCCLIGVEPSETKNRPSDYVPWNYGFDDILAKEARCLLSIALVNGGAINLSDKLYVLNETGLDLVRRTVSAERGAAGIPLDLFESDIASKWIQKTPSGFRVLLLNWGDEDKEFVLDYGALGYNGSKARNFWTDEEVTVQGNVVKKVVPAHSCFFLEFTK